MKAAVMRTFKAPLEIEEVQIGKPGPREVLVRTAATGVCHSDLHVIEGGLPVPPPLILGHEPAGVVEEVGSEVKSFAKGDPVIGCLSAFCGNCEFCATGRPNLCGGEATMRGPDEPPRLSKEGVEIRQFAHLSAFAERMLVHENALVKIRDDVPLDRAALIGCGVTTGLGAALNTAKVRPGSTCAVIGCGGVGLSALQGCRIAGASRILAIDTEPWKLDLAKRLGATDGVNASDGDPAAQVMELTAGGVDYAFECIGLSATAQQSLAMLKKGGTAILVGLLPMGQNIAVPGLDFLMGEKRLIASMMGSNSFRVDMPRYVDFYLNGQLKLDEMISARLPLDEINTAFDQMRAGKAARSVIVFD
ncbi:MAG: Zn-dependent alcohol dehydrogenase [Acidimicrobiia bacterium]|nr:Zn-dependent alcohol dehydrogenase [Acidimicrobiia bacterium]